MFYLLDVNVLIAASDPAHQFHAKFNAWFLSAGNPPVATCPLTENGFLRIYGNLSYPGGPGSPDLALPPLVSLKQRIGYLFLPDDLSLADSSTPVKLGQVAARHLTDVYLPALAVRHGGNFASFDTHIPHHPVIGGIAALTVIPTA